MTAIGTRWAPRRPRPLPVIVLGFDDAAFDEADPPSKQMRRIENGIACRQSVKDLRRSRCGIVQMNTGLLDKDAPCIAPRARA
jgi:hypothetical protein